jgi:hypothetical protein
VEDFRDKERREARRVVVVRRIWGWWGERVLARGWKTWSDKVAEVRKREEEMGRGLKVGGSPYCNRRIFDEKCNKPCA